MVIYNGTQRRVKKHDCFLIVLYITIHSLFAPVFAEKPVYVLSETSSALMQDRLKPIIFYCDLIPLTNGLEPVYLNATTSLGYGKLSISVRPNYYYSFEIKVNSSLRKPYLSISVTNNSLTIVDHTPRIIELAPVIPCKISLVEVGKKGSMIMFRVTFIFNKRIHYSDIIPTSIREMFGVKYIIRNGEWYPINTTLGHNIDNITLSVSFNPSNNFAYVNGNPIGFFPLYVDLIKNAKDIEKLCDNGIIRFSYKGFYGDILNYLGHRLFLQYNGPHMPLGLISDATLTIREIGKYEYIYVPKPIYFISFHGVTATVPVSKNILYHPWYYNASFILSHVRGFEILRQKYEWHNIIKRYPLCDIQYLYKYPISGNLLLPVPAHEKIFNASYVLITRIRLSR